jgi:hypothetical protein
LSAQVAYDSTVTTRVEETQPPNPMAPKIKTYFVKGTGSGLAGQNPNAVSYELKVVIEKVTPVAGVPGQYTGILIKSATVTGPFLPAQAIQLTENTGWAEVPPPPAGGTLYRTTTTMTITLANGNKTSATNTSTVVNFTP